MKISANSTFKKALLPMLSFMLFTYFHSPISLVDILINISCRNTDRAKETNESPDFKEGIYLLVICYAFVCVCVCLTGLKSEISMLGKTPE